VIEGEGVGGGGGGGGETVGFGLQEAGRAGGRAAQKTKEMTRSTPIMPLLLTAVAAAAAIAACCQIRLLSLWLADESKWPSNLRDLNFSTYHPFFFPMPSCNPRSLSSISGGRESTEF
jgi:hypothetical protein